MKLTAQDYRNAIAISQSCPTKSGMIDLCQSEIAELEKPAPKRYRCIKSFCYFNKGFVAAEGVTFYDIPVTELPFHFELIAEPEKPKPITMQEVHDTILSICIDSRYNEVLSKLAVRIYTEHDLS